MDVQHCEVWIADLGLLRPAHEAMLDDLERRRADTFVQPADRARFVLGVALLKLAVAEETRVPAAGVHVDRRCPTCGDPHGRPRLDGGDLELSVSHSSSVVAVALTRAGPVGIDLEHIGAGRLMPPARLVVTPAEPLRRPADVFTYWCRKESVLKATGEGLRVPLSHVVVSPMDEPARLIGYRGRSLGASMVDLDVGPGYAAALTVLTLDHITVGIHPAERLLDNGSIGDAGRPGVLG